MIGATVAQTGKSSPSPIVGSFPHASQCSLSVRVRLGLTGALRRPIWWAARYAGAQIRWHWGTAEAIANRQCSLPASSRVTFGPLPKWSNGEAR
jgi:hypothetical protein